MTRTMTSQSFRCLPKTYGELVQVYPPRPLHDGVDYDNAVEIVDQLAGHALTADQEDYLEAVSVFVETYEAERWTPNQKKMTPVEVLGFLLREHNMSGSDLGRLLGTRTLGPAILRGKRGLSKAHIAKLAEHFKVGTSLFL